MLQYSPQIVETGAICLEFSPNFLHSLLTPSFSPTFAPLLPQCWATRILEQWDDCNTQINIGEGENHTSVLRFVTSIVGFNSTVTLRYRTLSHIKRNIVSTKESNHNISSILFCRRAEITRPAKMSQPQLSSWKAVDLICNLLLEWLRKDKQRLIVILKTTGLPMKLERGERKKKEIVILATPKISRTL